MHNSMALFIYQGIFTLSTNVYVVHSAFVVLHVLHTIEYNDRFFFFTLIKFYFPRQVRE